MTWFVRGYEKDGSALEREVNVDEALLGVFNGMFDQTGRDLLGASLPLDHSAVARLSALLQLQLDPSASDYFLDFDAAERCE